MKVIISNFPIPDSFVENVAYTLTAMGHTVITPKTIIGHSKHPVLNVARDLFERGFPNHWNASERWAVAAAKQSDGADLLIWLTKSLRQEVLDEVKRLNVKCCVAWWGDAPANMRGLGLLAPGWDGIFIKDAATVSKFQAVGLPASLLHEACNPSWHARLFSSIGNEIAVAGTYYGYRQYLISKLLDSGEEMALYGPRPPRWASKTIRSAHRGQYITKKKKSQIFGEALICLNSTALSEGNSLNCRAFEIAGACGLQLIEDKPVVSECFDPDSEVLTYRCVDEIREYIAKARREPEWAMRIREAGHRRAHSEHTYEKRLRHIIESVGL